VVSDLLVGHSLANGLHDHCLAICKSFSCLCSILFAEVGIEAVDRDINPASQYEANDLDRYAKWQAGGDIAADSAVYET
jgi:hypothetical protein